MTDVKINTIDIMDMGESIDKTVCEDKQWVYINNDQDIINNIDGGFKSNYPDNTIYHWFVRSMDKLFEKIFGSKKSVHQDNISNIDDPILPNNDHYQADELD